MNTHPDIPVFAHHLIVDSYLQNEKDNEGSYNIEDFWKIKEGKKKRKDTKFSLFMSKFVEITIFTNIK